MVRTLWNIAGTAASRAEIAVIDVSDIAIAPVGKQKASRHMRPRPELESLRKSRSLGKDD